MFLLIELVIWAVICLLFVSYDHGLAAFITTVVAACIAAFTGYNVFALAWANPLIAGQLIVLYAGIGLVWCSVKWYSKLRKARKSYVVDKAEYLASGVGNVQDFISVVKNTYHRSEQYAPTVGRNKGNLGFWLMWWPFSIITFLLEDLIREVWNATYRALKGFFEKMRKKVLGEAATDLD